MNALKKTGSAWGGGKQPRTTVGKEGVWWWGKEKDGKSADTG